MNPPGKSSNVWKNDGGKVPTSGRARRTAARRGSALIVALWVIFILTLLISSMAFEMKVEANVSAFYRKRVKAQYLAQAGVEWAKVLLTKKVKETEGELEVADDEDEAMVLGAYNLSRGVGVSGITKPLGEGQFRVDILPEEGRRNVNTLMQEDWEEILDQANVPTGLWDELMDCFYDWTDAGDEHRVNGAESDDPYYEERGYKAKNAPLDTVDELLLIKGFTPEILYGGDSPDPKGEPLVGIAGWLTTWGDGRVNVNTATREVLLTLPGIEEWVVDDIVEKRVGIDGAPGTKDDGFASVDEVISQTGMNAELKDRISTVDRKYIRVVSVGEVGDVRSGIWCILQVTEGQVVPVFWREEPMD